MKKLTNREELNELPIFKIIKTDKNEIQLWLHRRAGEVSLPVKDLLPNWKLIRDCDKPLAAGMLLLSGINEDQIPEYRHPHINYTEVISQPCNSSKNKRTIKSSVIRRGIDTRVEPISTLHTIIYKLKNKYLTGKVEDCLCLQCTVTREAKAFHEEQSMFIADSMGVTH